MSQSDTDEDIELGQNQSEFFDITNNGPNCFRKSPSYEKSCAWQKDNICIHMPAFKVSLQKKFNAHKPVGFEAVWALIEDILLI